MALMKGLYPCVATIDGKLTYAIGAIPQPSPGNDRPLPKWQETVSTMTPESLQRLGTTLGMTYFSAGAAPICYTIPPELHELDVSRPLNAEEMARFAEAFRNSRDHW